MIKLLIVEDEPAMLRLLKNALEEENMYDICEATYGAQALEVIKNEKPQVIVLDIMLADVSGMDILKKVKEMDSSIQVIIITILTDKSFEIGAEKLGAWKFFRKPFDINDFKQAVKEAAESL